jgi:hypothetical protein
MQETLLLEPTTKPMPGATLHARNPDWTGVAEKNRARWRRTQYIHEEWLL